VEITEVLGEGSLMLVFRDALQLTAASSTSSRSRQTLISPILSQLGVVYSILKLNQKHRVKPCQSSSRIC